MTGLWTYPWCFPTGKLESTLETLAEAGIDQLKIAAHYHSVRTLDPKAGDLEFYTFPGGCLFDPDETYFQQTPIDPPEMDASDQETTFDEVARAAVGRGFAVDAWVVCLHGTRLASDWPPYQIEDSFGGSHTHSLCPSHPEVRNYFASVVENVAQYDVERIDLESIGFPSVLHDHGKSFGHHKDHTITNRAGEYLVSQCFCDGCREAAEGVVDMEAAQDVVSHLCRRYFTSSVADVPPLAALIDEYPILGDLFEFRTTVIEELLAQLAEAADDTSLAYYLADGGGYTPDDLWPSGVTTDLLSTYFDDLTVLCYTGDQETIDSRLSACHDSVGRELDAGMTVDPAVIDDQDHWDQLSAHVTDRIDGDLFVYNHGLMTDTHLEWVTPRSVTHFV